MTSVHKVQFAGVTAVYFLVGEICEQLSTEASGISAFWPPAGIALAAMLLFGPRMMGAVALAAAAGSLVDFGAGARVILAPMTTVTLFNVFMDAALTLGEAFLCWYPLSLIGASPQPLWRVRHALIFIALSAGVVPTLIGAAGSLLLAVAGQIPWAGFVETWLTWATGDSVGILVLTPLLIEWLGGDEPPPTLAWAVEMALAAALIVAMAQAIILEYNIAHLLVLPLIWASLRLGMRGTSIMVLMIAISALYVDPPDPAAPDQEFKIATTLVPNLSFVGSVALLPLLLIPALRERRLASEQRARLEQDMHIARSIQQGLLPAAAPSCEGFDIAGWSSPADEAGGDYYDWLFGSDGRLIVTLGDVTGHGVGPALVTTASRAYVRAAAQQSSEPGELLTWINNPLVEDLAGGRFITMAVACIDPGTGRVLLRSAGQGPLFIFEASSGAVEIRNADDIPLGVNGGHEFGRGVELEMNPGDMIVLLTDGFLEWADPSREFFGASRVCETIRASAGGDAASVIGSLVESVRAFSAGTVQVDDLTVVVIRRA